MQTSHSSRRAAWNTAGVGELDESASQRGSAPSGSTAGAGTSSRWCPNCDGQYVATAEMCVDCEVPLVDERTPDPLVIDPHAPPRAPPGWTDPEVDRWSHTAGAAPVVPTDTAGGTERTKVLVVCWSLALLSWCSLLALAAAPLCWIVVTRHRHRFPEVDAARWVAVAGGALQVATFVALVVRVSG